MLEMGMSGLMSGEGKRPGALTPETAPFLDSTSERPLPVLKVDYCFAPEDQETAMSADSHAPGHRHIAADLTQVGFL